MASGTDRCSVEWGLRRITRFSGPPPGQLKLAGAGPRAQTRLLSGNPQAFLLQRVTQPYPLLAHSLNRGTQSDLHTLFLGSDQDAE